MSSYLSRNVAARYGVISKFLTTESYILGVMDSGTLAYVYQISARQYFIARHVH